MKNKTLITAGSQGTTAHDKNGKVSLQKYVDTYESKSAYKNKNVQITADKLHLNLVQRQMYRRLMYGLTEYNQEQIASMSPSTISQIVLDYQKAAKVLQVMKAKIFYKAETNLVKSIFPHAKIGERDFDWFMELPKSATLNRLGITTAEIVNEFIRRRLLPKNFLSISPDNIQL